MPAIPRQADYIKISVLSYDILPLLHTHNGPDLISEQGRLLILHPFRSSAHILLQRTDEFRVLSFKNITYGLYIFHIFLMTDFPAAGTGTKPQVILKTGSVHAHAPASPYRKPPFNKAQSPPQTAYIGKRTIIPGKSIALQVSCHKDAGPFFTGNFHIRIRLIIPQGNVVFRMQFLYQVAFQNQRLHLRIGHGNIQIVRVPYHGSHFG